LTRSTLPGKITMSNGLTIRSATDTQWDVVSLGEVMLRLDPGEGRVRSARQFTVWEGGGEYNVARAAHKCFGLRSSVVTALPENEVGYLVDDCIAQGGVDRSHIQWCSFDGIGRDARVGLNFTERGFGIRPARGCSDRANSSASKMKPGDIDWNTLFAKEGARWFHTGGIYAALSETTPDLIIEAVKAAKATGTIVSYDLNYRPSLWDAVGGHAKAIEVNRAIAPYVDVMIGNEEDFTACLGFEIEGVGKELSSLNPANFQKMITQVRETYPNIAVVATTLRNAKSASINDWAAVLGCSEGFFPSRAYTDLDILDRVGGGDGFASGMIYAFLAGLSPQEAVDYGAAHGALAMTTPGDTSMVSLTEVQQTISAKGARVVR
jgi:2-dehydro-3-deoxygluconokinase